MTSREACFHGGASFGAIGEELDALERRHDVIAADVLDAWFPPAPAVVEALTEHLPWLARTSPPTHARGLVRAIARARGVPERCVLPGAGSSALVFLALRTWLGPHARVLMLEPTYGEYAHVCERVVGCTVERLPLRREDGFRVDLGLLGRRMREEHDLVVLVNPNNPTGQHIPRDRLAPLLADVPARTRCWIDEAYVDYAGPDQSLEAFAARSPNVVVCKSLSKAYALSGLRAAYLVACERTVEELAALTPPWALGLPAQLAAVRALQSPGHYADCHLRTHALRDRLVDGLRALAPAGEVHAGVGNWVLWYPPPDGAPAAEIARRCRERGLYLREFPADGSAGAQDTLRVAVKDEATQRRVLAILREALPRHAGARAPGATG